MSSGAAFGLWKWLSESIIVKPGRSPPAEGMQPTHDCSPPPPCQLLDLRHPHWHLCMPLAADPRRPHVGEVDRSKGTLQSSACQQLPSGILGICPPMGEWGQAAGAGCSADTTWISTRRSHLMHSPDTPKIRAVCWLLETLQDEGSELVTFIRIFRASGIRNSGSFDEHVQRGSVIDLHRMCHPQSSQCQQMVL